MSVELNQPTTQTSGTTQPSQTTQATQPATQTTQTTQPPVNTTVASQVPDQNAGTTQTPSTATPSTVQQPDQFTQMVDRISKDIATPVMHAIGTYFGGEINARESVTRFFQADSDLASRFFYSGVNIFANDPGFKEFLAQKHPEVIKEIAAGMGFVPKGTTQPTVPIDASDDVEVDPNAQFASNPIVTKLNNDIKALSDKLAEYQANDTAVRETQIEQREVNNTEKFITDKLNSVAKFEGAYAGMKAMTISHVARLIEANPQTREALDAVVHHAKAGNMVQANNARKVFEGYATAIIEETVKGAGVAVIADNQTLHNRLTQQQNVREPNSTRGLGPTTANPAQNGNLSLAQRGLLNLNRSAGR